MILKISTRKFRKLLDEELYWFSLLLQGFVSPLRLDRPVATAASNQTKISLVRRAIPAPSYEADLKIDAVLTHCSTTPHSPLVVFGGPGTGKTSTLVRSVISRINIGADPNSILILTYGRESASDLRDQIVSHTDSTAFDPLARTFHSLAFSILNEEMSIDDHKYLLISGAEQDAFIRNLLRNAKVDAKQNWPSDLELALPTRGFAREVRDLILRANERELNYDALRELGKKLGEKYWGSAIAFWDAYDGAMALRYGTVPNTPLRIDPSLIISKAIQRLEDEPDLLARYRERFPTIYVDEFQESDESHRKLLAKLATNDLTIFADGDSAIGRFRGADPDSMREIADKYSASVIELETNHRSLPAIAELGAAIASRINTKSPGRQPHHAQVISEAGEENVDTSAITALRLSSQSDCANYIAHAFRTAHLRDGIAWSEMAVILRSPGSGVSALTRAFALNNIPINIDASASALGENPLIRPLLLIARIATGDFELAPTNWEVIEELLRSPIAGADSLSLRAMRLSLNKAYQSEYMAQHKDSQLPQVEILSEMKSSVEIMIEALTAPVTYLPWEELAPLKALNDLISTAKNSLRLSSEISDLLWAIWSNAKDVDGANLANSMRSRALKGGVRGAAADRDLDAVMQLFEAARRFSERMPGSDASLFIDEITGETILSDSITAQGDRGDLVTVTTVHSAKGRQWRNVAIMGLQEGSWPNLRQRGSLLGSERLVESIRTGLTVRDQIEASAASALVDDERRLLHVATTRATNELIVLAHAEEDAEPSSYFEEIYEFVHGHSSQTAEITELPRALTAQALVATLRRELMNPDSTQKEFAASLLSRLSAEGIESANPENWWGFTPTSTTAPIVADGAEVRVSPSKLQSFSECQLKWFLENHGGRDGDSSAALIGSAIHALASLMFKEPDLTVDQLKNRLSANWKMIDSTTGWVRDYEFEKATEKVAKFYEWHLKNQRELIGVEVKFDTTIGRARLTGSVDRLEIAIDESGASTVYIVDLKTGGSGGNSETKVQENMQLSGYQLAVARDGFIEMHPGTNPGGAELLFLGGTNKSASSRTQFSINVEQTEATIIDMAESMATSTFTATINPSCRMCGVKLLCPLQPQGRGLLDERSEPGSGE